MSDDDALSGRRIIVTGGARGIGESAVRAFAGAGAAVVSFDVTDDAGTAAAAAADAAGSGSARFVRCDVSDRGSVESAFAEATAHLGGLDALVHVAGVERGAPAEDITDEDWDVTLGVNLRGTFLTNQAAFPHMKERGGRIVNFASGAGLYPYLHGAHYSASKAGVIAWTRTIAHEWGRYGITAVAVNPAMWTPMYQSHRDRLSPDQLAAHDAEKLVKVPLGGKLGDPDSDLAPVLVFLVGEGSRFITAQIISVDGGMVPLR
jgi:NAD(P)-dependent dehydrogenase (short-subunit alcohol dehydrogenase family)